MINFSVTLFNFLNETKKNSTQTISFTTAIILASVSFVIALTLAIIFFILHFRRIERYEDNEFLEKNKSEHIQLIRNKKKVPIIYNFFKRFWQILGILFAIGAGGSLLSILFLLIG